MADVHDKKTRSYNMSQIRSKDTKPEMLVRKFLFSNGFRYRLHDKKLLGKPDIVLPKWRTVIFVHGCFWHGHANCKYFVIPQTRIEWCLKKIKRNQELDKSALEKLQKAHWNTITVFECDLKTNKREKTLLKTIKKIGNTSN